MNNDIKIVEYRHIARMKKYRCLCSNKKISLITLLDSHKRTKRHKAFMNEFNETVKNIVL